jgi:hypothetical protein
MSKGSDEGGRVRFSFVHRNGDESQGSMDLQYQVQQESQHNRLAKQKTRARSKRFGK